ncbi:MAG: bacillithiol biosynthesis deacetylase BshB1 [Candidatus Hydrothermarchaeales archaeon]
MKLDVLVVGAHPDDAELGAGGTIAKLEKQGRRVGILDLSDGEPTPHGTPEIRRKEAEEAAKILGVDVREILGLENRKIIDSIEARKEIANIIRKYKPEVIITHPKDESHPDHIVAYNLVFASSFYARLTKWPQARKPWEVKRIFHFPGGHQRVNRKVSFIVDISDFIEQKIKALECYKSQLIENVKNRELLEIIPAAAKYYGSMIGRSYGEAFICEEEIGVEDLLDII